MRHPTPIIACLTLSALVGPDAPAAEVSIVLPPETAVYRKAAGVELAQSFCLQCHSADYAAMQPPMPAKFWDAEVKKMREKYSAPLPPELDAKLVEYLAKAYGTGGPAN